jgi:hypothetical protein
VLAAASGGAGVPGLLGLLLAMEAGLPVPIPSDLVMLLLGERVSAGALPLWVAVVLLELGRPGRHRRPVPGGQGPGPGAADPARPPPRPDRAASGLGHRAAGAARPPALATGRTTPGLRTVTVVAAASSGIRVGRALPALVLGSSLFLQAHLLLGYALGRPPGSCWSGPGCRCWRPPAPSWSWSRACCCAAAAAPTRVLAEGACPACLALGLAGRPVGGRRRPTRSGAESPGGGA